MKTYMKQIAGTVSIALLMIGLAGCSALPDWLGAPSDPPLEGKREPAFDLTDELKPDPGIAHLSVNVPKSSTNTSWLYSRAMLNNNVVDHPAFPGKASKTTILPITLARDPDTGLVSSPISADETLFLMDSKRHIYAFDWSDLKKPLWKVELPANPFSTPLPLGGMSYDRGMVFVTTGSEHIVALDARTGKEMWRKLMSNTVRSVPFAFGDNLYVVTTDNRVYALKRMTGEQVWIHDNLNESLGLLGSASLVVNKAHLLVPYSTGVMYSLDPATGREQWGANLAFSNQALTQLALNDIHVPPVIQDDHLFISNNMGVLFAISLDSGAHIWQQDIGSIRGFWNVGEYVFVLRQDSVVAIHGPTAKIRWSKQLVSDEAKKKKGKKISLAGPVLAGDFLYVTSSQGKMFALSPTSGEIDHEISILPDVKIAPAVVMNKMVLVSDHGKVVVLH